MGKEYVVEYKKSHFNKMNGLYESTVDSVNFDNQEDLKAFINSLSEPPVKIYEKVQIEYEELMKGSLYTISYYVNRHEDELKEIITKSFKTFDAFNEFFNSIPGKYEVLCVKFPDSVKWFNTFKESLKNS